MTQCTTCQVVKPDEEYYVRVGRHASKTCKDCARARMRLNAIQRCFKMTPEQYDEFLAPGVCASCGRPPKPGRPLSVDHDHSCCPGRETCGNCLRGPLCGDCNLMIGHAKDNPALLRAAADYLERYSE